MDSISIRVAARFAASKSYKLDRARTNKLLRECKNPKTIKEEQEYRGGYETCRVELIPIRDIIVPEIWSEAKAQRVREDMDAGKALMPVRLSPQGSKWVIDDGIHRTNVSRERGYTHVPALIQTFVPTPEKLIPEAPEKPQLHLGDWVKMNKPYEGKVYGWVDEVLSSGNWRGVKRHHYIIALVSSDEVSWPNFCEFRDTEFEPSPPPPWGLRVKNLIKSQG